MFLSAKLPFPISAMHLLSQHLLPNQNFKIAFRKGGSATITNIHGLLISSKLGFYRMISILKRGIACLGRHLFILSMHVISCNKKWLFKTSHSVIKAVHFSTKNNVLESQVCKYFLVQNQHYFPVFDSFGFYFQVSV